MDTVIEYLLLAGKIGGFVLLYAVAMLLYAWVRDNGTPRHRR